MVKRATGQRHDEAEFRLVDAAVLVGEEAHDDVGDFAGDGGAEHAAHEGGDVDQPGLEGGEVVGGAVLVDVRDGLGEDDEPADGEGVDERAPEDARVGEEDEGPEGHTEPVVLAQPAGEGSEGLDKGFFGLRLVVLCVVVVVRGGVGVVGVEGGNIGARS